MAERVCRSANTADGLMNNSRVLVLRERDEEEQRRPGTEEKLEPNEKQETEPAVLICQTGPLSSRGSVSDTHVRNQEVC